MPNADTPDYQVDIDDDVIRVVLRGHWNLSLDRDYLQALANAIDAMPPRPWGIVVDMRNWSIKHDPLNIFEQNVSNIHLDRTNQVCECWIVNHLDQASELAPFIESEPNVTFKRVLTSEESDAFLALLGLNTPHGE